jgi:hypothetical protein
MKELPSPLLPATLESMQSTRSRPQTLLSFTEKPIRTNTRRYEKIWKKHKQSVKPPGYRKCDRHAMCSKLNDITEMSKDTNEQQVQPQPHSIEKMPEL